ncbi:MAG: hypothetical protein LBB80_08195, partial [Treponema sp.]|nr:hypothetical protein [Treponema sp.]
NQSLKFWMTSSRLPVITAHSPAYADPVGEGFLPHRQRQAGQSQKGTGRKPVYESIQPLRFALGLLGTGTMGQHVHSLWLSLSRNRCPAIRAIYPHHHGRLFR